MGSWDYSCAISGLSMGYGTPCRALIMTSENHQGFNSRSQTFGACGNLKLMMVPILCEYDDYGSFNPVNSDYGPIKTFDILKAIAKQCVVSVDEYGEETSDNGYKHKVNISPPPHDMKFRPLMDAVESEIDGESEEDIAKAILDIMSGSSHENANPSHMRRPQYWDLYRRRGSEDSWNKLVRFPVRVLFVREDVWQKMLTMPMYSDEDYGQCFYERSKARLREMYTHTASTGCRIVEDYYVDGKDKPPVRAFSTLLWGMPIRNDHDHMDDFLLLRSTSESRDCFAKTYLDLNSRYEYGSSWGGITKDSNIDEVFPYNLIRSGNYKIEEHIERLPRNLQNVDINSPQTLLIEFAKKRALEGMSYLPQEDLDILFNYNLTLFEFAVIERVMSINRRTFSTASGCGSQHRNSRHVMAFCEAISEIAQRESMREIAGDYYEAYLADDDDRSILDEEDHAEIADILASTIYWNREDIESGEVANNPEVSYYEYGTEDFDNYRSFYNKTEVECVVVEKKTITITTDTATNYGATAEEAALHKLLTEDGIHPSRVRILGTKTLAHHRLRGTPDRYDRHIENGTKKKQLGPKPEPKMEDWEDGDD